jgi:hypothetical protein
VTAKLDHYLLFPLLDFGFDIGEAEQRLTWSGQPTVQRALDALCGAVAATCSRALHLLVFVPHALNLLGKLVVAPHPGRAGRGITLVRHIEFEAITLSIVLVIRRAKRRPDRVSTHVSRG